VKPQAGIFVDRFADNPAEVDVQYTMVADELALYDMSINKTQFNVSKIEVDVQRRLE
jgi:hypothetical protein